MWTSRDKCTEEVRESLGFGLGVFNSYNAEFDCLLNGNAGVVTGPCVSSLLKQWGASLARRAQVMRARVLESKAAAAAAAAAGAET